MSDIARHIERIRQELPAGTRLVAVSKFHTAETIMEAYEAGQRIFGESRVQELVEKYEVLPKDIEWHFIGHLQTNKVKYIVPFITLIHSVDSEKLLSVIESEAAKCGRVVDCLLEIHVAQEDSKYGFTPDSCRELLQGGSSEKYPHVRICGLMGMATNDTLTAGMPNHVRICGLMGMATQTDDEDCIEREFSALKKLFDEVKGSSSVDSSAFCELSMGMSHDYPLALRHGSTLVRIGTSIFGERVYSCF